MGLWKSLERLPSPAAVLAEWQLLTGEEFDLARLFLRATDRQSDTYPCTLRPGCGNRHEVVDAEDGMTFRAVSRDEAVTCRSIAVEPHELLFHELDTAKLCAAVRREFGFEPPASGGLAGLSRSHAVGIRLPARTPVVLTIAPNEAALLKEILGLVSLLSMPRSS
jgi:hypothetical protein